MKRGLCFASLLLIAVYANSSGQTHHLTVSGAWGSGDFTASDTVHLLANPNPAGKVFDRWSGAVAMDDTFSMHTWMIMPSTATTVTAVYAPASTWTPLHDAINGSEVYYYFPATYKGLISLHHGHGGSASGWFDKVENLLFVQYAVAHGYAVFATESKDRTDKSWDTNVNSVDIANIVTILDTLRGRGLMTASTKLFGVGMSQGSGFTSMIAAVKGFAANALYCVPGIDAAIAQTQSPTQWCIAQNDTSADQQRQSQSLANYTTLKNRGIGAEFFLNRPSPVLPTRFWRVPGIDSAESRAIYTDLKTGGYLDSKDYFKVNPALNSTWYNAVDQSFAPYVKDIEDQITVCFTEHKFFSDFSHRTIVFFGRYAGTTATSLTPIVSARSAARPAAQNPGVFDVQGRLVRASGIHRGNESHVTPSSNMLIVNSRRGLW